MNMTEDFKKSVCVCVCVCVRMCCVCISNTLLLFNRCDISPAVEERQFWLFELCALLITGASYAVVYIRQRKNDQLLMEKIHRQIGLST